jgi:2-acylglycerol O-acyltransferase 2
MVPSILVSTEPNIFHLTLSVFAFSIHNSIAEGRFWPWFGRLDIWKRGMAYFPARIEYEVPLDPKKQYIFGSHPHGSMGIHHALYAFNAVGFYDVSQLTTDGMINVM